MKVKCWLSGAGVAILTAGTALGVVYEVDPSHTTVGFSVRHMGISSVRGSFADYTGTIEYDGATAESIKAKGVIKATSVNTGNEKRDEHLRNEEFFHVEKFPEISFETSDVVNKEDGYVLKGNFTMHGVTKPLELEMTIEGPIQDPWQNQRIGMALEGVILRHEFGVGFDGPTDKLIGKEVKIEIQLEATAAK